MSKDLLHYTVTTTDGVVHTGHYTDKKIRDGVIYFYDKTKDNEDKNEPVFVVNADDVQASMDWPVDDCGNVNHPC